MLKIKAAGILGMAAVDQEDEGFFASRRRHTRCSRDWSSDVCSSDLFAGTRLRHHEARNEEPKACTRESAGGATAQVVAERRLLQPLYPLALEIGRAHV